MSTLVTFPGLGLRFNVNRIAFSLGSIDIYWYGVILATGLLLGVVFAFRHCVEFGIDADRMVDVIMIGTVMAIVCARIYYVAMAPFKYDSFLDMLDIRQGGIAIYGALIGAFVFGGLACKWRKIPLLPMFDLVGMGFLIGQGIGRWGNFVNQEAFGCNTTLPWGMYSAATQAYLEGDAVTVPLGKIIDPTLPVHPTFLYESIWCLAGFVMLFFYFKKRKFDGDVALRYAIWYGLGRFWIEGLRTDSLILVPNLGLRASQMMAAVTVAVALVLEVILARRAKAGGPLRVKLAVSSDVLKKQKSMDGPTAVLTKKNSLRVDASRAEFIQATDNYNAALMEALNGEEGAKTDPKK